MQIYLSVGEGTTDSRITVSICDQFICNNKTSKTASCTYVVRISGDSIYSHRAFIHTYVRLSPIVVQHVQTSTRIYLYEYIRIEAMSYTVRTSRLILLPVKLGIYYIIYFNYH